MKPRVPASKYKKFIEFVEFLKANNSLHYFNVMLNDVFSSDANEYYWILDAFVWSDTDDGDAFWCDLDDIWQDRLQREQNR